MTQQDKPNTNFWFGFALGSITLTAAAYMLGTKKGREKLKQLLQYADTIEDMPEELFQLLPKIKEMLKNDSHQDKAEELEKKESFSDQVTQSLESIIEKVKSNSEEAKPEKKYFVKSET